MRGKENISNTIHINKGEIWSHELPEGEMPLMSYPCALLLQAAGIPSHTVCLPLGLSDTRHLLNSSRLLNTFASLPLLPFGQKAKLGTESFCTEKDKQCRGKSWPLFQNLIWEEPRVGGVGVIV